MRVTQRRRMRTWPLWSPHQQKPQAEPSSRSQPVGVHADIEACACSVAPQVGSPNPLRTKRPQNALKWAPDSDPPSGAKRQSGSNEHWHQAEHTARRGQAGTRLRKARETLARDGQND